MMQTCGLLGRKLSHSYSPRIHSLLADYAYLLFEKEPEELAEFLENGHFLGLNVTIPYKKSVVPFCTELSETAKVLGSVNTLVRRSDGTLYGDNTDAFGFAYLVRQSGISPEGKKALVLGSGGASVTVCAVLRQLGAREVTVISRSGESNYENLSKHADAEILVNTTPVGMYPGNGEQPVDLRAFPQCCGVLDIVYNPARTALLLQAEALGIPHAGGLSMLVAQAKRSSELFTGRSIPDSEISRIEALLRREMQNLILIGMPGSGKSTIAALLGQALGRKVVDTDAEIERRAEMPIPQIFAQFGEEHFRRLETEVLQDFGKLSGSVLSTGGGCVTREENYPLLRQNGVLVWVRRDTAQLARDGRPLSQGNDLQALYEARRPLYERFADLCIENDAAPEDAVERILEALE